MLCGASLSISMGPANLTQPTRPWGPNAVGVLVLISHPPPRLTSCEFNFVLSVLQTGWARARLGGDKKGTQGTELGRPALPTSECLLGLSLSSATAGWAHPCVTATALPCPAAHKGRCPDPPHHSGFHAALAYTERLHPISSQPHFFTVTQ